MPPMAPHDSLSPGGRGTMTLPDWVSDESVTQEVERETKYSSSSLTFHLRDGTRTATEATEFPNGISKQWHFFIRWVFKERAWIHSQYINVLAPILLILFVSLPCLQSSPSLSHTQSPVYRSQMRLVGQEQVWVQNGPKRPGLQAGKHKVHITSKH